jgi:hypothetical protein
MTKQSFLEAVPDQEGGKIEHEKPWTPFDARCQSVEGEGLSSAWLVLYLSVDGWQ